MTQVGAVIDEAQPPAESQPRAEAQHALATRTWSRVEAWATSRANVLVFATILVVGAFARFWELNRYGFNSDEAVYAGQGAAIAGQPELSELFPVFRAHPLLFQSILSIGFHLGGYDLFGRVIAAVVGLATVYLTYRIGTLLYGAVAGLIAGGFLAVMPYHVLVTRQVLLDGPMVLFSTLALYLLVRYALSERPLWLYAAGASMGLTFLSKETGVLMVGSIYVFFALSPEIRVRIRHLAVAVAAMAAIMAIHPATSALAGKSDTGGAYLAWQLFRRPNHGWTFYPVEVSQAIGWVVLIAALAGFVLLRTESSWRERLLLAWICVPAIFFELWPVKGFQYLLPVAPAVALLAARTYACALVGTEPRLGRWRLQGERVGIAAACLCGLTLMLASWARVQPQTSDTFLAGSGGLPGGRETGLWIRDHVPKGAVFLTVGPSMANVIQYYGQRKAFGLSVSPNPLRRNPSYEPVKNPDLAIRNNDLQYVVWDSYSAARSTFFADKIARYADRFNGRAVYTQTATARTRDGTTAEKPLIIVYQVRPLIAAPRGEGDD